MYECGVQIMWLDAVVLIIQGICVLSSNFNEWTLKHKYILENPMRMSSYEEVDDNYTMAEA